MEPRISIVGLGVSDLSKSVKFYHEGLGLPMSEFSNDNIAFFNLNGAWLSLFPKDALAEDAGVPSEGSGFSGTTLAHNVKTREEVDTVMQEAENAGATITKQPEEKVWGGYSGHFSDPDGYIWEVAWNPHFWVE